MILSVWIPVWSQSDKAATVWLLLPARTNTDSAAVLEASDSLHGVNLGCQSVPFPSDIRGNSAEITLGGWEYTLELELGKKVNIGSELTPDS